MVNRSHMTIIHSNQRLCGDEIMRAMFEQSIPHIVLLAQMQMGKSGTYWHVILNALVSRHVDSVYIISGNRERELCQQVSQDVKNYTEAFSKEHPGTLDSISGRIKVLWGSDLYSNSKKKPPVTISTNSLIVWDESHYAQSIENTPFQFFKHNRLEKMLNGSMEIEHIQKRGIYLLNVSATPFSQLYANAILPSPYRKVVRLIPDKLYCGLAHYMQRNRIMESFVLSEDTANEVSNLLQQYNNPDDPKYMILRARNIGPHAELLRGICHELGIAVQTMNCTESTISVSQLKKAPTRPTAVVITGMLRMGKVVPKEHISMVFESKTINDTINADTGMQGLLGRMCGYAPTKEGFDIDIYVEPVLHEMLEEYVQSYDSVQGPLCMAAMNLKKKSSKKVVSTTTEGGVCEVLDSLSLETLFDPVTGKMHKKAITSWILSSRPDVPLQLSFKNLSVKSNQGILKKIENCKNNTISHSVEKGVCYVCKKTEANEDTIWLVYTTSTKTEAPSPKAKCIGAPELELDNILDKCVFKPVIN